MKKVFLSVLAALAGIGIADVQAVCGCGASAQASQAIEEGVNDDIDGVNLESDEVIRYQRAKMKFLGEPQSPAPELVQVPAPAPTKKRKPRRVKRKKKAKKASRRPVVQQEQAPEDQLSADQPDSVVGRSRAKMKILH